ncbi:hypothetical protein [Micromonospora aurantiaca (nom. illeg.)]|uniref:hypothetical protein n=1 Tax=Micromonospora aurantiaca (nom. illeg.) TaxID=47850 RepID=UPI003F4A6072
MASPRAAPRTSPWRSRSRFAVLLDRFEVDVPVDEDIVALEYLRAAIDLLIEVRGRSAELDALRDRTERLLAGSPID